MMVATAVAGVVGIGTLSHRAEDYEKRAGYHCRLEFEKFWEATRWEQLARDPSKEADLRKALYEAGQLSRGEAIEAELEALSSPPSPRRRAIAGQTEAVALRLAQSCRTESDMHGRKRQAYARVALNPWLPIRPEPK
jgi:hypothetical protein